MQQDFQAKTTPLGQYSERERIYYSTLFKLKAGMRPLIPLSVDAYHIGSRRNPQDIQPLERDTQQSCCKNLQRNHLSRS